MTASMNTSHSEGDWPILDGTFAYGTIRETDIADVYSGIVIDYPGGFNIADYLQFRCRAAKYLLNTWIKLALLTDPWVG